jgi:hypothetical protein
MGLMRHQSRQTPRFRLPVARLLARCRSLGWTVFRLGAVYVLVVAVVVGAFVCVCVCGCVRAVMQPYLEPGDGPIVLVLAPTRELALQIKQE